MRAVVLGGGGTSDRLRGAAGHEPNRSRRLQHFSKNRVDCRGLVGTLRDSIVDVKL
jgi:hypothetical protein